jgi:hypothetical protein
MRPLRPQIEKTSPGRKGRNPPPSRTAGAECTARGDQISGAAKGKDKPVRLRKPLDTSVDSTIPTRWLDRLKQKFYRA